MKGKPDPWGGTLQYKGPKLAQSMEAQASLSTFSIAGKEVNNLHMAIAYGG